MAEIAAIAEASAAPAPVRATRREAFNAWFVTHEVARELAMAAMAIVYVALRPKWRPTPRSTEPIWPSTRPLTERRRRRRLPPKARPLLAVPWSLTSNAWRRYVALVT